MEVLLIDDDPVARLAIAHVLQEAGYRVRTVGNGPDALEVLRQGNMQLVVCDWSMPGMNGLDVCRAIREEFSGRFIYILMLTSNSQPQDTINGLAAGADDYVTKPFNPVELTLRINTGRRMIHSESRDITIFAMAKLAESRDRETGDHLERVRSYCRILARQLRTDSQFRDTVDDEYVRLIYDTSPLHDIGKVAIPDAILLKPGKLSVADFEIMKTHTTRGARTLSSAIAAFPNARFLKMAHDIALSHHERYDGHGYPHGIAGQEISLCARIVALADVYDALTSKRVYKSAMPHNEATSAIVAERGGQFDPDIVDAFLAQETQFREQTESRETSVESIKPLIVPSPADRPLATAVQLSLAH